MTMDKLLSTTTLLILPFYHFMLYIDHKDHYWGESVIFLFRFWCFHQRYDTIHSLTLIFVTNMNASLNKLSFHMYCLNDWRIRIKYHLYKYCLWSWWSSTSVLLLILLEEQNLRFRGTYFCVLSLMMLCEVFM